jgi:large subunit ribosomal protein L40e
MGKFPIADAELNKVLICKKCKSRNSIHSKKCRKCGYSALRTKHKEVKRKK